MKSYPVFMPGVPRPLMFAHRGCPLEAPENTLTSFQKVLDNRIPGIELDIQRLATGEVICCHDRSLKRLSGDPRKVENLSLADVKAVDAGSHFSADFAGEKLPLLEEVFSLLGDKVYYDIEIKAYHVRKTGIEKALLELIRDFKLEERVMVTSFNPIPLRRFRTLDKSIPLSVIYTDENELPGLLRKGRGRNWISSGYIKPDFKSLNQEIVGRFKAERREIFVWTVDEKEDAKKMLDLGVDGIISNCMKDLMSLVKGE